MSAVLADCGPIYASLDECGGDESVLVEYRGGERYCYIATKVDGPDGIRGLSGYSAADAIDDLNAMLDDYAGLKAERAIELSMERR